MKITLIGGTHSLHDHNWWKLDSLFSQFLAYNSILPLRSEPFIWSTDLDGFSPLSYLLRRKSDKHNDWEAGGAALRYFLDNTSINDRNIICHSHGLQVVAYAAQQGMQFNQVISVCSPIRSDLYDYYNLLSLRSNYWTHLFSYLDTWQLLGELLDGQIGLNSSCPYSDLNIKFPHSYGHSSLLYNQDLFPEWIDKGILDSLFMKGK